MAECMRCGQLGHIAAQCSQPPTCNNCGGKGHLAKACPAIRCDRCGRAGHMARECTKGGNMRCYECGENGHISRDCPQAEKRRFQRPVDPEARRKDIETSQFHRARGQMLTQNNLSSAPARQALKTRRLPEPDDAKPKKFKIGALRPVAVIKPKGVGEASAPPQPSLLPDKTPLGSKEEGGDRVKLAEAQEPGDVDGAGIVGLGALAQYGSDSADDS